MFRVISRTGEKKHCVKTVILSRFLAKDLRKMFASLTPYRGFSRECSRKSHLGAFKSETY
jgi:hypothetical protein